MTITYTIEELPNVAQKIINSLSHNIICFDADMGLGKTTLIKQIVKSLGVNDVASSPTFSIVNEYKSEQNKTIYHFDMYRIEEEEALDFGIEEYFYSNHFCLIEWPERIPNLIPQNHHIIKIEFVDENTRTLSFE